jgi:hypothetical protein
MKALVRQSDGVAIKARSKRGKVLVMHVGGLPIPGDNLAAAIEQPAEFDADDPAMATVAFPSPLVWAAARAPGMDQFDAVRVDHGKAGGSSQKLLRPGLVCAQRAQETRAVGQSGKERLLVAREPAIQAAEAAAFKRAEQPECDELARPQLGLRMFGARTEAIIDEAEEVCEKLIGSHGQTSVRQDAEHIQSAGGSARGALAQPVGPHAVPERSERRRPYAHGTRANALQCSGILSQELAPLVR